MKKILVIALAVVMLVSVFALTACGTETYTGECHYANKYDATRPDYGVKVDVAVSGGVIKSIKIYTDEETGWTATTTTWTEGANQGDLGYEATVAAYEEYLGRFVGKTVDEVKAIVATATQDTQSVDSEAFKLAGATQSSARIIVAIQNALAQIK